MAIFESRLQRTSPFGEEAFELLTEFRKKLSKTPLVVFTADQDWAPEWACEIFVDEIVKHAIPLHIFRTNSSEVVDAAVNGGHFTQGWHPNFKANSTHGTSIQAVIETMRAIAPTSRTVRAHSYFESSEIWDFLFRSGQVVESHGVTAMEENLVPIKMASGLLRIPVFFEDDVLMRDSPGDLNLSLLKRRLLTPGMKVLDFHPIHIALNSRSVSHYEEIKPHLGKIRFDTDSTNIRGIRNVLLEIVDFVNQNALEIICFEKLVDQLLGRGEYVS